MYLISSHIFITYNFISVGTTGLSETSLRTKQNINCRSRPEPKTGPIFKFPSQIPSGLPVFANSLIWNVNVATHSMSICREIKTEQKYMFENLFFSIVNADQKKHRENSANMQIKNEFYLLCVYLNDKKKIRFENFFMQTQSFRNYFFQKCHAQMTKMNDLIIVLNLFSLIIENFL